MRPSTDDPSSGTSKPKIAIKGFSLSSKSSTSKPGAKPTKPSSSLGKRPRSKFAAHDDSASDSEAEGFSGRGNGKHEVVTGFGEGGAIKRDDESRKAKEVLVIPRMENRDWRGSKKGKNLLPPEVQREREAKVVEERGGKKVKVEGVDTVNSGEGEIKWGLSVRRRVADEEVEAQGDEMVDGKGQEIQEEQSREEAKPEQTADQEALSALLGTAPEKKGPDLVIPTTNNTNQEKISEEDAYKRSIAAAPDVSTLEDYERVPVEEFGAALLRGMGWKGEKVGKVRDVKRRQNLLGLGARELKDAEELGAWVQKSDVKRLNEKRGSGKGGRGESRPKVSEYAREKERRDERREERGGGGYRREQERERSHHRNRDGERERDRRR